MGNSSGLSNDWAVWAGGRLWTSEKADSVTFPQNAQVSVADCGRRRPKFALCPTIGMAFFAYKESRNLMKFACVRKPCIARRANRVRARRVQLVNF